MEQIQPVVATQEPQLTNTSAMASPRLHGRALRFIGRVQAGMSEAYALQQLKATSQDLVSWKRSPDFLMALEAACQLRSAYKRADALAIAEDNAAPLMAEAVSISYESKHDRDRLSAIMHVHKAAGIGVAQASGVIVNVDLSARAYASTQTDQPHV